MARQSQLLRGVFPVLFHPLPAPVWADDVDSRVNFGMDIGESLSLVPARDPGEGLIAVVLREGARVLQVGRHGDRGDGLDSGLGPHQHHEGGQRPLRRAAAPTPDVWQQHH